MKRANAGVDTLLETTGSPFSKCAFTDVAMVWHGHGLDILILLVVACNKNENEGTAGTNGPTDRLID